MEEFPPELQVALAYAPPEHRDKFAAMFELDLALARAVAGASEAIVGQVRLAWWRDALRAALSDMPRGNPLLDRLSRSFGTSVERLVPLVDGWEAVLTAEELNQGVVDALVTGRQTAWECVSSAISPDYPSDAVRGHASRWALADLAAGLSNSEERSVVLGLAPDNDTIARRLPKSLRPLAILDALAKRSLSQPGRPLLADRTSAMVALRVGIFGR